MTPIHARLLAVMSRLQTSPDAFHKGLAGWVSIADDISEEPPNIRITAGTRETWYRITAVEQAIAQVGGEQ